MATIDFTAFNNFFDHVYVISLKRATERHEKFIKELEGLDYSVFYGMDKNNFDVDQLKASGIYDEELARKNERHGKSLSPGMIGASWSHRLVYEDVIKQGYKRVLIFEDDMVIDRENWKLVPQVLADLPANWDLLYFGFTKNEKAPSFAFIKKIFYHLLSTVGLIKYSHTAINNLYPKHIKGHLYKAGLHDCLHAYGLSLSAAKKLVPMQTPISHFPDNLVSFASTNEIINGYVILPKIINQETILGISSFSYVHT